MAQWFPSSIQPSNLFETGAFFASLALIAEFCKEATIISASTFIELQEEIASLQEKQELE